MTKYLNQNGVSLPLAIWLATDSYDKQVGKISVTSLIKPLKQQILSERAFKEGKVLPPDISSLVKSRTGTAIHDSIESAWINNFDTAMKALGWPEEVIQRVKVNPNKEELESDTIAVYLERRSDRTIDGVTVSGKFDFCAEGRIRDFKSTGVYTFINNTKDTDYQLQGSMYRWLNTDIITDDVMTIDFILTDHSPGMVKTQSNYPEFSTPSRDIPLLSLEDTEAYIKNKISMLNKYRQSPEEAIPPCTEKELWQDPPKYKYYADPKSKKRATKNFDNHLEAQKHLVSKGKGVVDRVEGKARACNYCSGFEICKQKDRLIAQGLLDV